MKGIVHCPLNNYICFHRAGRFFPVFAHGWQKHGAGSEKQVKVNLLPFIGQTFAAEYERALTKRRHVSFKAL